MDKLLELVQEKAGISADQARKAVDTVMDFMKDKLPAPLASQVAKYMDDGGDDGDDGEGGGMMDKVGGMFD